MLRGLGTQDDKAVKGKLVGYFELGYRVLIDGKIVLARNVKVVEPGSYVIVSEENDERKNKDYKDRLYENNDKMFLERGCYYEWITKHNRRILVGP
ncbi:unnamed protein product [Arctia plantaginis]|uniref:Uncharacterized protein n=1 Tax=Arctia plantaginis TaxID=874455 RepID=A0A8S0ZGM7_ARCPL|nr:unnamed protein product [Arctia plantaginis]CAB3231938.1 unnamed protein product [Arctia plantaginis]